MKNQRENSTFWKAVVVQVILIGTITAALWAAIISMLQQQKL
jgi:hypothetical protein